MAVHVLGPLEAGTAALSPRERTVLSALVVRRGTAVTPRTLAEACWGEDPPSTWRVQVRTAISRIRAQLGAESVHTVGSDYRLGLDLDVIDAVRFERTVAAARRHCMSGEWDRAVDAFQRALAMWRGDAFQDLPGWEPATSEAARLTTTRASVEEELLEARLRGGDFRGVIPDAEQLVREQPLREERWAILALANYQAGRQAEALAVIRAAKSRLLEELGIDLGTQLAELQLAILNQDPSLEPSAVLPRVNPASPYRGLEPFDTDHAATFFGREADIEALVERASPGSVVAIAGPSGSGKSSLLLAGVLPRLADRGRTCRVLRPGDAQVAAILKSAYGPEPISVIAVDQVEELLQAGDGDIESFCRAAYDFVGGGGTVVLTVRSDFLDVARALPHVGDAVGRGIYLLGPLSADSLREAVEQPARDAGLKLEAGLVELVLRDAAGRPAVLPHLSHALLETWTRREGATLTVAGYQAAGGIAGGIATSADQAFLRLSASERDACRALMSRLVVQDESGAWLRRRTPLAVVRDDHTRRRVVQALASARLVSIDHEAVSLAHEAVTEAWPRLAGWLAEDAKSTRLLASLTAAAEVWNTTGRMDDDLLRGAKLHTLLEWQVGTRPHLTAIEAEFLATSAERAEDELREITERAARDRRQNTRLRWSLTGVAGLLVIALTASGVAALRGAEAAAAGEDASIEALVSTSIALRSSRRDVAALLAAEAYQRWPNDARSRAALMGTLTGAGGLTATRYFDGATILDGVPIPGTTRAVLVPTPGTPGVYDVESGELVTPLELPVGPYRDDVRPLIAVSRDGSTGVVGQLRANGFEVTVVDLETGGALQRLSGFSNDDGALAVSDDGSMVAGIDPSHAVLKITDSAPGGRMRGTVFPREHRSEPGRPWMTAVGFAPNGDVVVGADGTSALVFEPERLQLRHSIQVPADTTNTAIAGTGDGRMIAAGHAGVVALDPVDGTLIWHAAFETPRLMSCAWLTTSESRGTAYCGNHAGTIVEHSLADGHATGRRLDPQLGRVGPIGVSPDGSTLFSFGIELPAISVWRLDGSGAASRLVASGQVAVDGYDPSGTYLLTAEPTSDGEIGTPRVWDVAAREAIREFPDLRVGPYRSQYSGLFTLPSLADLRWPVAWVGVGSVTGKRGDESVLVDVASGVARPVPGYTDHAEGLWPVRRGEVMYVGDADNGGVAAVGPTLDQLALPTLTTPAWFPDWVSASPAGELVAITSWVTTETSVTEIADPQTGIIVARGLDGAIATAFVTNGEIVAAWPTGRLARFDPRTLELRGTIPGSHGAVTGLSASEDGQTLLASSLDGSVTAYDVTSGERLGDPIASNVAGRKPGFLRPDGKAIAVNTRDGVVVWSLDPANHLKAACRIAGRNLTTEEWATYLSELGPHRETCPA